MKKILLPLLAIALLLGTFSLWASPAEGPKTLEPVAVVSLSGYDEVKGDIEFVGKLSDNPHLANGLEALLKLFTKNRGLAGLDKARPWGAVIQSDGDDFVGYGFIPVTDLDELLSVMKPFVGEAKDVGGGVLKVKGKGAKKKTLYIVEQEGWAFFSENRDALPTSTVDPKQLLGDLPNQYDVAVKVDAENLPEKHRRQLIAKIKKDSKKDLQRKEDESDAQYEARKMITKQIVESVVTVLNDLDEVTIGWSLDRESEETFLEVTVTAKEGSETAQAAATLQQSATDFGGFRLPDAALAGNWSGTMPKQKIAICTTIVEAIRKQAMADIEKEDKSDAEKEAARKLAGDLLDVIGKTVKSGNVDGGMAVLLDPESVTLLAGGYVADGATLEKLAKQVTAIVRAENPVVGSWVKLNAEQCEGVRLHTVSIPIPDDADDREKVVALIGEKLDLVVGLGRQSMYVAAGRNAVGSLKQVIQKSASAAPRTVPPIEISLALEPIAKFVAQWGEEKDRPKAKLIAEELAKTAGQDRINLTAAAIPNGVKYRLEIEEGLLRLAGQIQRLNGAK